MMWPPSWKAFSVIVADHQRRIEVPREKSLLEALRLAGIEIACDCLRGECGLCQVNVTIPAALGSGDLSLVATVGGVQTQSGVAISLAAARAPQNSLTGYWTFAAQSTVFGFQSGASGQLTQNGNSVSGQLSLSGTPCASSAVVSGMVSGSSMSMTLNENGQLVTFSGTVSSDGSSANGTYVAPPGGCTNGDHGTWSGVKN